MTDHMEQNCGTTFRTTAKRKNQVLILATVSRSLNCSSLALILINSEGQAFKYYINAFLYNELVMIFGYEQFRK